MLNQPDPSGVTARMTLKAAAAPPAPAAVARLALMEKRHRTNAPSRTEYLIRLLCSACWKSENPICTITGHAHL